MYEDMLYKVWTPLLFFCRSVWTRDNKIIICCVFCLKQGTHQTSTLVSSYYYNHNLEDCVLQWGTRKMWLLCGQSFLLLLIARCTSAIIVEVHIFYFKRSKLLKKKTTTDVKFYEFQKFGFSEGGSLSMQITCATVLILYIYLYLISLGSKWTMHSNTLSDVHSTSIQRSNFHELWLRSC